MSENPDPTPSKATGKLKRIAYRLVRIVCCVYLFLCLIVAGCQDSLIFPGAAEQGKPESRIQYGGDAQTLHLTTAGGIPIAAVYGASEKPDSPTILYFYGNAGAVAWSQGEFDHFRRLGCNALIPDLAGYGESGGKASESNFYATADAAWDYLQSRPDIDHRKIIVVGWSLGAAVAIDLGSRKSAAGLATFNAFTSLPAMARKQLPWAPTVLLLKYRFDNQAKIGRIHCPMLICNGAMDTLVPPTMSDQLAATAGGPVTRLVIQSADHNSIFIAEPEAVWDALAQFVAKISGGQNPDSPTTGKR